MQVVILAGGLGTRIQAVAPDTPKALIPVAGRPFIEHQFALLRQGGLRDVVLCVGHMGDQIEAHVGDGRRWGLQVSYAWDPPAALLGTGGALVNALPQLAESFLVMYGDSYLPIDYGRVVRAFEACSHQAMMCVFRNRGAWDKSNVRIADGRVVFYAKDAKPGTVEYIDYGLTAYRRALIRRYGDAAMPLDLARILMDEVEQDDLAAFEVQQRFYEIGKPEGLRELEQLLADGT